MDHESVQYAPAAKRREGGGGEGGRRRVEAVAVAEVDGEER